MLDGDFSQSLAMGMDETALEAVAARHVDAATLAGWVDVLASADVTGCRAAVRIDNSIEHAALLFFMLARGISPLILPADSMAEESRAYVREINTRYAIRLDDLKRVVVERFDEMPDRCIGVGSEAALGLYLLTSGSTGRPSLVFRSLNSWRQEARRYIDLLHLTTEHRVLLVSPIYHAYVLGWLWAVAESGCVLEVFRPTQLTHIINALRGGATHCALTPFCASLLARRAGRGSRPPRLEVVMAGAGPVDEVLDAQFQAAFGVGLSRNYGSTETGALLAGIAPLPPLSVGWAMPNLRIVPQAAQGEAFPLVVELEDGRVHPTGDIVCEDECGYRIIGRETAAIRRGEAWISPFEIESVLRQCPLVDDCQVRRVRSRSGPGNDHIVASVVQPAGTTWSEAALRQFCCARLRQNKVPDLFERVETIRCTDNGKPAPSLVYRWAEPERLIQAAGAYKQSAILFALMEVAGLERFDGEASVDEIAFEAGLHADSLGELLDVAARIGLLRVAKTSASAPLSAAVAEIVALERDAASTWNSVDGMNAIVRQGRHARSFATQTPTPAFVQRYQCAMNGPHKQRAMQLVLRKLRRIHPAAYRLLDISATSGAYSSEVSRQGLLLYGRCALVGGLNVTPAPAAGVALAEIDQVLAGDERFDVMVLDNAVHQHGVASNLIRLSERLEPGGTIVVDDLFLESGPGAAIGVDWMTHGGTRHSTEQSIDLLMLNLGLHKQQIVEVDLPVCHRVNFYSRT